MNSYNGICNLCGDIMDLSTISVVNIRTYSLSCNPSIP